MACKNELKESCFKELDEFILSIEDKQGALISVLHKAQEIFGYLPKEIQEFVAERLDLSLAKVYGVVSFYSFFTMTPKGKHPVSVCMGTACYVRGAGKVLEDFEKQLGISAGETTVDGEFSIDALRCVGACGLAPVVLIGEDVFGKDEAKDVAGLIAKYRGQ
ncbi:NADH dehydrogenase [Propionigenium maris DSM 9537]|uniref:NADH dehydrogenase n=1 Tax=Propionigenium maris DSM 9537 TaxID=1123000 RepID=A0A9W6LNE4_9FUSO|nr:NAD(P)H-dependent oxidoreductase subunit E [Propionigenium maris]GLI55835.1 NADH dehydrogenase [Propionigenium maris DSM 9537]